MKNAGRILNIQHFCVDDGPGIRTTVFFKGCPLSCAWCHNPETQASHSELIYRSDRCAGCGACVSACQTGAHVLTAEGHALDREKCIRCMKCAKVCRYEALESAGMDMTVDEVLSDLLSDRAFYETSGGGVTLSGGEPTAQPQFAEALLRSCRDAGLSTAVETCLFCPADTLLRLAPATDLFLVDWKLTSDALHRQYTGVSNALIRENLARLCKIGARVILRCPMIPDVNLTEEHYNGIVALANAHPNIEQIDLEGYHPLGVGKSETLGKTAPYRNEAFLDKGTLEEIRASIASRVRIPVTISGN
ncbi:MAG: glycyl-radical enzyme activating protein [Clostridia bacterium]|nr:glycyl-radical enzyme activating protein [Clostridia bacterium]